MLSDTFKREIRLEVPNEINLWVALTALIARLDRALREIRGREQGRRKVTMWATDESRLERKTVSAAYSAMKQHGLTPAWCIARAAVGPLQAERGRYEITASKSADGTSYYLRVALSSSQKLNADALATTARDFDSELQSDAKRISEEELARVAERRSRESRMRTWITANGTSLAINLVSAIVGGVIATLVIVFGFGIR